MHPRYGLSRREHSLPWRLQDQTLRFVFWSRVVRISERYGRKTIPRFSVEIAPMMGWTGLRAWIHHY